MTSLVGLLITVWATIGQPPARDERGGGGGPST